MKYLKRALALVLLPFLAVILLLIGIGLDALEAIGRKRSKIKS